MIFFNIGLYWLEMEWSRGLLMDFTAQGKTQDVL
jgi:hypothetical protein